MNLVDENFPADQLPLLDRWGIRVRLIGRDEGSLGLKDPEIIPLLHQLRGVTFFTQDWDFYKPTLCHPAYGLVWLDVGADDAAVFLRRFLRHPSFNTKAKRMGLVARAHRQGISLWRHRRFDLEQTAWLDNL